MFIVQNAKYLNTVNVSSELVALFYQSAVQCLILQHASRVQCQSYCGYFDLITATTEKSPSYKHDVANGTRKWRALQPTVEIQLEP